MFTEVLSVAERRHVANGIVFPDPPGLYYAEVVLGYESVTAYWVVSDHFEELGRPPALLHGGFVLRTVGELRNRGGGRWPSWSGWARPGSRSACPVTAPDRSSRPSLPGTTGEISVLAWNMTLDQTKAAGSSALGRQVTVVLEGLPPGASYTLVHDRVDADPSNIASVWDRLRKTDQPWPDDDQWQQLREADRLEAFEPPAVVVADDRGTASVSFDLPMPAMSFLSLRPLG